MIIQELKIKGCYLLKPDIFEDNRGSFRRTFCKDEFRKYGINPECKQGNLSYNRIKGTLRGFHYQNEPYEEDKTITCVTGSLYDVIIDLRKESETFLMHESISISAKKGESIHIAKRCANAWLTLEDMTIIHYYMGEKYVPNTGKGIRYDDPRFKIKWPAKIMCISEKDKAYKDFDGSKL